MYFKHRELDLKLLASGSSLNRRGFAKILALGLFDILISFPIAILSLLLGVLREGGTPAFWPGWKVVHSEFPLIQSVSSDEWKSAGSWTVFLIRFDQWVNPLLAIVFFVLFGLTEKNWLRYRDLFRKSTRPFGLGSRSNLEISDIAFDSRAAPKSGLCAVHITPT